MFVSSQIFPADTMLESSRFVSITYAIAYADAYAGSYAIAYAVAHDFSYAVFMLLMLLFIK